MQINTWSCSKIRYILTVLRRRNCEGDILFASRHSPVLSHAYDPTDNDMIIRIWHLLMQWSKCFKYISWMTQVSSYRAFWEVRVSCWQALSCHNHSSHSCYLRTGGILLWMYIASFSLPSTNVGPMCRQWTHLGKCLHLNVIRPNFDH